MTASGQRPSKWTASAPTKPLLDLAAVHDVSGSIEIDQIDPSSPDLTGDLGKCVPSPMGFNERHISDDLAITRKRAWNDGTLKMESLI